LSRTLYTTDFIGFFVVFVLFPFLFDHDVSCFVNIGSADHSVT